MKTETKKVYYCDHCRKHGLSKPKMEYHEKVCFNNPANSRECFYCKNLVKKEAEIAVDYCNGSEFIRNVDLFYCKAKSVFLHTPKNEIKGNRFFTEEEDNIPMPIGCELYGHINYDDLYL